MAEPSPARAEVLDRVRRALQDGPAPEPVVRDYRQAEPPAGDLVTLLTHRLVDYRASVTTCTVDAVAEHIAAALDEREVDSLAVPAGFPADWLAGVPLGRRHAEPMSIEQLDALDGTVSTCAVAIAETGTIVLDAGPGQGRRALSLVPDYLLIVVRAGQIVASVPAGVAAVDPERPLTWISGPSATSDIELRRVEGVHGPRVLHVLIVADG